MKTKRVNDWLILLAIGWWIFLAPAIENHVIFWIWGNSFIEAFFIFLNVRYFIKHK
jgi:hypothetical protein